MRLKELAEQFVAVLSERYGNDEAHAIFLVAISHVLRYSRIHYLQKRDEKLAEGQKDQLLGILDEIQGGRPVQYVVEQAIFYGLTLTVNESVLIPRPETEELVHWVLDSVGSEHVYSPALNILDIGTGSGCIALSLKKHLPDSRIAGLDISNDALSVARLNSDVNQLLIDTIQADIRDYSSEVKYDVIVSNPPYVTLSEKDEMSEHVLLYEPHTALFVSDERPLVFYEAIVDFSMNNLVDGGLLFFEINEHLGKETVDLIFDKGFINTELQKDMQGKDRMIKCVKP